MSENIKYKTIDDLVEAYLSNSVPENATLEIDNDYVSLSLYEEFDDEGHVIPVLFRWDGGPSSLFLVEFIRKMTDIQIDFV